MEVETDTLFSWESQGKLLTIGVQRSGRYSSKINAVSVKTILRQKSVANYKVIVM